MTLLAPIAERVEAARHARARREAPEARGTGGGAPAAALAVKLAARQPRQRRAAGCQAPLLARRQAPRSWTAPARRARPRGNGRGPDVCDTVQTAVDAPPTRRVAGALTHAPGDRDWRRPRVLPATAGRDGRVAVVADGGYDHGRAVTAGREAGLTPDGPRPLTTAHAPRGLFRTDDGRAATATATHQWPAGA